MAMGAEWPNAQRTLHACAAGCLKLARLADGDVGPRYAGKVKCHLKALASQQRLQVSSRRSRRGTRLGATRSELHSTPNWRKRSCVRTSSVKGRMRAARGHPPASLSAAAAGGECAAAADVAICCVSTQAAGPQGWV